MVDKLLLSKKIAIFGWPATGKSTFGIFLSDKLHIEVYSLDMIRWKYSEEGLKNDKKFLNEYEEILKKDQWIMEGNALDFIDSRLKQADILIFFDSTIDICIENYNSRAERIKFGKEKRLNCNEDKITMDAVDWIKNRYAIKIEKLRPILPMYKDKLIIINSYNELNNILAEINLKNE